MRCLVFALCGLLLSFTGCASAPVECADSVPDGVGEIDRCCYPLDPMVEVGTGETEFEELAEGAGITMVHGPQGGWHLVVGIRAHNTRSIITIELSVVDRESGVEIAAERSRVALVPGIGCDGSYPGMFAFIDVSELAVGEEDTPPELLGGHMLDITATISDSDNRTATVSSSWLAELDPIDM